MWEAGERTRATFYSTLFVVRGVGESQTQFHRVSKLRAALTQKMFPQSSWRCSSPVVQRQKKSALLFHLAGHPNNSEEYHTGFYWGQPYISSGQWPLSVVSIIDLEARLAWANLDLPNEECDLLGNSVWGCARVRNAHESPLMDQKQKPF